MASSIDICNLALSYLGDEANVSAISPSDGSAQADHCVVYYPLARDALLAMHAWSFATARVALAQLSTSELPGNWQYAYAMPSDCLQPIAVLHAVGTSTPALTSFPPDDYMNRPPNNDDSINEYICEVLGDGTKVIFTNVGQATLRYVRFVTDTAKFSPLFVTACARLLASYLAGPLIKGETGMKIGTEQMKVFLQVDFPAASIMDSKGQKRNTYREFTPAAMAARQ